MVLQIRLGRIIGLDRSSGTTLGSSISIQPPCCSVQRRKKQLVFNETPGEWFSIWRYCTVWNYMVPKHSSTKSDATKVISGRFPSGNTNSRTCTAGSVKLTTHRVSQPNNTKQENVQYRFWMMFPQWPRMRSSSALHCSWISENEVKHFSTVRKNHAPWKRDTLPRWQRYRKVTVGQHEKIA